MELIKLFKSEASKAFKLIILMAVVSIAYFACARWLKIERA